MTREVIGEVGLFYSKGEVAVVIDPAGQSMIGDGIASITVRQTNRKHPGVALLLGGPDIDKLIILLRTAKRKLLWKAPMTTKQQTSALQRILAHGLYIIRDGNRFAVSVDDTSDAPTKEQRKWCKWFDSPGIAAQQYIEDNPDHFALYE